MTCSSRWNTIGTTFRQNTSIVKFPEFELFTGVTGINMAFQACTRLNTILLPPSLRTISSNSFRQASAIVELTLPAALTSVENYCLFQMTSLRKLTSLATTPPSVTTSNELPSACQIYVPASSVNSYKSATWWSNYASRINPIPE